MIKQEPVDIKKQTQYVYVPGLDLYAAYKIGKLPQYAMVVLGIGIPIFAIMLSFYPISLMHVVIPEIAILPVAIYLIKKWSKEWNKQFSNATQHGEDISSKTPLG